MLCNFELKNLRALLGCEEATRAMAHYHPYVQVPALARQREDWRHTPFPPSFSFFIFFHSIFFVLYTILYMCVHRGQIIHKIL